METWTLISLWIIQTLVGAVLWRRFLEDNKDNDGFTCFIISAFILPNFLILIVYLASLISTIVDYLAGKGTKNKRTVKIMKDKLQQLIEKTKGSITLEINLHRDYNETVINYLKGFSHENYINDISKEIYDKMVETDTIIELHVYPNTPNSFYKIYGYDLNMVLNEALLD